VAGAVVAVVAVVVPVVMALLVMALVAGAVVGPVAAADVTRRVVGAVACLRRSGAAERDREGYSERSDGACCCPHRSSSSWVHDHHRACRVEVSRGHWS
jgi:hypothetical protein